MSQLNILKSSQKDAQPVLKAKKKKRIQSSFIHKALATTVSLKENAIAD